MPQFENRVTVTSLRDHGTMATHEQIAEYVLARFGPSSHGVWAGLTPSQLSKRPPTSSVDDLALWLVHDGEFRALQLGTWLATPMAS